MQRSKRNKPEQKNYISMNYNLKDLIKKCKVFLTSFKNYK